MTCPDPANNRECVSLYNGECLVSQKCPEMRHKEDNINNKLIATFNAYDYDEARNYANLYKYIGALLAIRERVRAWRKHGHNFKSADAARAACRTGRKHAPLRSERCGRLIKPLAGSKSPTPRTPTENPSQWS